MPNSIGFVQRLEVFGNDLSVVNAARVSFNKESKILTPADVKLLKYLANHNHISPFFHPQIRFRIKMPIFVAREWFRHTVGLSRNEVSRRYVDSAPQCWVPEPCGIRERDPKLKQGSRDNSVHDSDNVNKKISEFTSNAVRFYKELLDDNVAPEIARCVLPQSMYTEFIETGSLYAYARICALRTDPGAQREIRRFAEKIDSILSYAFPEAWKALRGARINHDIVQDSKSTISLIPLPSNGTDVGHYGIGC